MPKKDKYWFVPWIAVAISALILGVIGRYIALDVSGDTGTANLTFLIVVGGCIFIYVLFIALWDSINPVAVKKRPSKEDAAEQKAEAAEVKPEETGKLPAESALQKKIDAFCKYSDNILSGYVAAEDIPLLHKYIEQYANNNFEVIPQNIKTHTIDTFDLCHYGWNIWNHFGKVVQQPETAVWLIKVFAHLKDYNPNSLYKKFTHKERMTYTIPIEDDIK